MQPTNRGILILLLTAPILAAATWLPLMRWIALAYFVIICLLIGFDWKTAESIQKRFDIRREHDQKLEPGGRQPHQNIRAQSEPAPVTRLAAGRTARRLHHLRAAADRATLPPAAPGKPPTTSIPYGVATTSLATSICAGRDRWAWPFARASCLCTEPVKVYPNLLDVRRYDLLLRRNRLQEIGLRNTRQFGEGTEFERLREYLPDDEYRRIDWKATARRHRPVTVEYQTERSQNVIALLDVGRMMQSPWPRLPSWITWSTPCCCWVTWPPARGTKWA